MQSVWVITLLSGDWSRSFVAEARLEKELSDRQSVPPIFKLNHRSVTIPFYNKIRITS